MWTISTPFLLTRTASPSGWRKYDPSRRPFIVNTFFLGLSAAFFAVFLSFSLLCNAHYNHTFDLYRTLDPVLSVASSLVAQGLPVPEALNSTIESTRAHVRKEVALTIRYWRGGWITMTVAILVLILVSALSFPHSSQIDLFFRRPTSPFRSSCFATSTELSDARKLRAVEQRRRPSPVCDVGSTFSFMPRSSRSSAVSDSWRFVVRPAFFASDPP